MKPKGDHNQAKTPADAWQELIQSELKAGSKIGKTFEIAEFGGIASKVLKVYFKDEALAKIAKGQSEPLKKKLPPVLLPCDRVQVEVGSVPTQSVTTKRILTVPSNKQSKVGNPLQALNFAEFGRDKEGKELFQPVLEAAVSAEKSCDALYAKLKQRTESLVGIDGVATTVDFNWRVRVGGTRGFRELLLPVFHPVFGIPFIPASSLKGAARAWATGEQDSRIRGLLGILDGKVAIAAKVEFLDAFPTKHCLSVDVATPQWHWQTNKVVYKPEPHPLLSMQQPQLLIGLRPTARGTASDVQTVKEWLENALKVGIGSRVSSGYGKALGQVASLPCRQNFDFKLWTQGMFGGDTQKVEFRPTAVRGILRYWFRAFALSLYDAATCQALEEETFGKLSQQGKTAISVLFNDSGRRDPYRYDGKICLEAKEQKYLDIMSQILILASHLGGVGRGSRRPLHRLNGRMRGCHWSVDGHNSPLEYNCEQWQSLFQNLRTVFQSLRSPLGAYTSDPGRPKPRYQDVLDTNAQVWLIKSLGQVAPNKVTDWQTEGDRDNVRGSALTLVYSDQRFKGERRFKDENKVEHKIGNPNVGGALEIPSFVWIKSIFASETYQVVTVFGINQDDRKTFIDELEKLSKQNQAILVFGQMPSGNQPSCPKPKHK